MPWAARRGRRMSRWLGVGRAQIIGPRRCGIGTDGGADPCHPGNIRRRLGIHLERWRRIRRPAVGEDLGGVANEIGRAIARGAERFRNRGKARPQQRATVAADHLEIHLVMPRIDRRDDRLLDILADNGRGVGRQRGHPDRRFAGGERDAARSGQPDPQAGETAGAGGHRDAVERCKCQSRAADHARDQRHQRFGMAAFHGLRFLRHQFAGVGVEHRSGTGIERRIDGEDQHREQANGE